MKKLSLLAAVSTVLFFFQGCQPKVTQEQLLRETAQSVITALYLEAATAAEELANAAETYQKKPSPETLTLLGANWKKAAIAWQRTEPYRLGPATDLWLSNKIGYQNIRPGTIDGNVAKIGTPAEVKLSVVGASGKGYFAMGYLLFHPGGQPKTPSPKEAAYLALAARDAAGLTRQLGEAWSPFGQNYAKAFADGGQASLNKMVNGLIESIERLKEKRIARLLGREAVWGDDTDAPSKTDPAMTLDGDILAAPLEGIDRLFSLPSSDKKNNLWFVYLSQAGSAIGPGFSQQNRLCIDLTQSLPVPLNSAAAQPALEKDYAEIKKLVGLSKSSLVSALGVTLTFNSNDGD